MAKLLFVDDEPAVLAGYERTLHREFEIDTAEGGELGLDAIRNKGSYAVIISDMRMPGMNGAQFLSKARESAPESVRMLLTGYTDLAPAMEAVNEGHIYRFLTKPCAREALLAAMRAGVEQYELIRSEKELLEKTLLGSIKVMADFLNASNPQAFGRSMRLTQFVRYIAGRLGVNVGWRLEAAATLSQLGCVTLDSEIIQSAFVGVKLSPEEQARFNAHPEAAMHLLSSIPRLEPVAWMIGHQLAPRISIDDVLFPAAIIEEVKVGAEILKLAVAFDDLRLKPMSDEEAIVRLRTRSAEFDRRMLDALVGIKTEGVKMESRRMSVLKVATGMILDQELRNQQGMLIFPKNQEITRAVLLKLHNFAEAGAIAMEVLVLVPV